MARIKRFAERRQQFRLGFPFLHIEQTGQVLVKLSYRQSWIEDVSNQHRAIESLHHPAQYCGFASTDLARYDDQSFATLDAVVQIGHHLGVRRSEVDESRIGSEREWQFF